MKIQVLQNQREAAENLKERWLKTAQRQSLTDWSGEHETPAGKARVRRSTLAQKETTSKLAEAVPAESECLERRSAITFASPSIMEFFQWHLADPLRSLFFPYLRHSLPHHGFETICCES